MSKNVIQDGFRLNNLRSMISSLSGGDLAVNKLYLGIGRPQKWSVSSDVEPQPSNSGDNTNLDWEDICALKRISSSDVSFGIVREKWKANTKYDQYRNDWGDVIKNTQSVYYTSSFTPASLADAKYYCVTSQDNVFVCIKQGTDTGGAIIPSTYEPGIAPTNGVYLTPTDTGVFKANDGYYWKFIANVSVLASTFRTSNYDGVTTLTSAPDSNGPYWSQWQSQLNSMQYRGGIYAINIKAKGAGYNGGNAGTSDQTSNLLQIVGNGSGIEYTVTYGAGGTIENIEITVPGSGYSYAQIITTGGSAADFDIVYTPSYGLGTDPVKDLSALYLLVNTTLDGDEGGDFFTLNDFRKIVLVMNPKNYGTVTTSSDGTACTSVTVRAATRLTLSGGAANSFASDDIVVGSASHAAGVVVQWTSGSSLLEVISPRDAYSSGYTYANHQFQIGDQITSATGLLSVVSIDNPETHPYSGEIIYSENRSAITRGNIEKITIVVQY